MTQLRRAARVVFFAALPLVDLRPPPRWPAPDARLVADARPRIVSSGRPKRVMLDAGHGAAGNSGNRSSRCVDEQDFTAVAAREIGRRLEAKGFTVALTRPNGEIVDYHARVDEAARWNADAFVSLHSDVRGTPRVSSPCVVSPGHDGFAILWSDEGDPDLVAARLRLARATAHELSRIGLPHFDRYADLYAPDGEEPGVLVDRHPLAQRIFLLKKTTMPAVLVETHNAWDSDEADRWTEPRTFDAVASALATALDEALPNANEARAER